MKHWLLFPFFGLSVLPGCSVGISDAFRQQAARRLVVAVDVYDAKKPTVAGNESSTQTEPIERGSGTIIGADQHNIYLVTAKHVLGDQPRNIQVSSSLWSEGPVSAEVKPIESSLDIALLRVPRYRLRSTTPLAIPYWHVWTPDRRVRMGESLAIVGRQHGLKTDEEIRATESPQLDVERSRSAACGVNDGSGSSSKPSRMVASALKGPDPNQFQMQPLVPPTSGDSGGGVFAGPSHDLVGLYPECTHSYQAYHMDRVIESIRSSEFGRDIPISLAPSPYRPDFLTWIGAASTVAGVGFGSIAYWLRHRHYADPDRSAAWVTPFNVAADSCMLLGAVLLFYQLAVYDKSQNEQNSALRQWSQ